MSQIQNGAVFHHIPRNCRHNFPNIKFRYTASKAIEMIMKSLNKKCTRTRKISVKFLKWSAQIISFPLTYIFNKTLETGFFPFRLIYYTVKQIFRTGDRLDIANFRRIY